MRFLEPRRNPQQAVSGSALVANKEVNDSYGHLCPINQLNKNTRSVGNFRPLCPVKLNGHSLYALIDSGNVVVNAISEKFANDFSPDNYRTICSS